MNYPVLRFSAGDALVRHFTNCPVGHVEFEREDLWTFGSRLDGGVKWRPPSESNQQNVIRATFPKIDQALAWAAANRDGFPYDSIRTGSTSAVGARLSIFWIGTRGRIFAAIVIGG